MNTSVSGATDTQAVEAIKETVIAIKNLTATINENSKVTKEQNDTMVKYTRGLFILTVVLGIIAIVQVIAMFCK